MKRRPVTQGATVLAALLIGTAAMADDALTGALKRPNERGTVAEKSSVAPSTTDWDKQEAAIEFLLKRVETSKVTFLRNGKPYPGTAAATHLRRKYNHARSDIHSVEDFIRLCATRSEATGKPYFIETASGQPMESSVWMVQQLKDFDAGKAP